MEKTDSSYDQKYADKANQKDDRKSILRNHLEPLGVDMTSKFAQAALKAMEEHAAQFHKQETAEPSGQPYFHLSRNEYGKAWLFYKPSKGEVGKYCCWEPIDDEFYMEFEKMQKAARRAVQDTQEKPDSGWISVKERLPEEAKPVWCFESPNHQFSGIYTKGHEIEYENDDEDREFDAEEERRGSLLLKAGWYEEVEQVQATYDFFWMPRNVTHWRPLAGKPE